MIALPSLTGDRPQALPEATSRRMVQGLRAPRDIAHELPVALQEDEFCMRFVTAFDEVVAAVYCTLDCFDSYLDPRLAPDDFAEWLATWVGVEVDETWELDRRRRLIERAALLYRIRGTVAGLAEHLDLYAAVAPEIEESGACAFSETSGAPIPGAARPHLTVRLRVDDPASVKHGTVSRIVASSCPAHVTFDVEILAGGHQVEAPVEEPPDEDGTATTDAGVPGAVEPPGTERVALDPQKPEVPDEAESIEGQTHEVPDDNDTNG